MTPLSPVAAARPRCSPRLPALLLATLSLAACVQQPAVDGGSTAPQPQPVVPARPPSVAAPVITQPPLLPSPPPSSRPIPPPDNYPKSLAAAGGSPAVLALAKQAQAFRSAGRHQDALGQYERALRIEPKNAFVWQAIAETQLAMHNVEQAESAARKSNSLARSNPWLEMGNWRVIAAARAVYGDTATASAARARADEINAAINASAPAATAPAP